MLMLRTGSLGVVSTAPKQPGLEAHTGRLFLVRCHLHSLSYVNERLVVTVLGV